MVEGGRVPIIADVLYNRVKGYSRSYMIGCTGNTRNKHRNTQCDYIKVFTLGFFRILNSFLTIKPSQCLNIRVGHSQILSVISEIRHIPVRYNEGLLYFHLVDRKTWKSVKIHIMALSLWHGIVWFPTFCRSLLSACSPWRMRLTDVCDPFRYTKHDWEYLLHFKL
jgi:hypothetical protein